MAPISSSTSSARFARAALVCAGVVFGAVALRGEQARACGGFDPAISDLTTFDPDVLDNVAGLEFDPFNSAFGQSCTDDCVTQRMLADWRGYLKDTGVTDEDWKKLLFAASEADLKAIRYRLSGKATPAPKGYEQSTLWKLPGAKATLLGAIGLVELARRIEPFTATDQYDNDGNVKPRGRPPAELLTTARKALKATRDPFLSQRYAFAAIRILFYQRDWPGVVASYDSTQALLGTPSADLSARARYYLAGALAKTGRRARANVELARIHANYAPLAGVAAQDFRPMEELDWRESLRLAKSVREKTELWRLVGLKQDGLVAAQEIIKLDPKSDLVALLVVRELARAESRGADLWGQGATPDPKEVAAQKKAFAALEQLALAQTRLAGTDRPWLMELVAGHIAAKRGELATARPRLLRAVAGRPGDVRVASQAKASLALALALDWKITPQQEDELARSMNGLDPRFGRLSAVRDDVRHRLAKAYAKAGKLVEAEFLRPGTVDPIDESTGRRAPGKRTWGEVPFIKEMIARARRTTSEFDRFVLKDSHQPDDLEQDLALRYLLDGDFATAAKTFQTTKAKSVRFATDPFASRIVDCHDCDHEKFQHAKWTHASFAVRLAELEIKAKGGGEAAAAAAMLLGNALYNITWYGNARVVLEESHQDTRNTTAAMYWYKRAHDLSSNRELKAKAAYLAAKAELGNLWTAQLDGTSAGDDTPVPRTWYPVLKGYANTKYYKAVLKECGYFAAWVSP